jgi:hypothetical protein
MGETPPTPHAVGRSGLSTKLTGWLPGTKRRRKGLELLVSRAGDSSGALSAFEPVRRQLRRTLCVRARPATAPAHSLRSSRPARLGPARSHQFESFDALASPHQRPVDVVLEILRLADVVLRGQ